MDFIKDVTKKVAGTAKVAVKKSSDLVEITKLNINIGTEKDKITKVYTQIGKIVCDSFEKGEEVPENFKVLCEKVSFIKEGIKKMKKQILQLKNIKICPSCGTELEIEVAFCSRCGAKQEIPTYKRLVEDSQNHQDSQNNEEDLAKEETDQNTDGDSEVNNVVEETQANAQEDEEK